MKKWIFIISGILGMGIFAYTYANSPGLTGEDPIYSNKNLPIESVGAIHILPKGYEVMDSKGAPAKFSKEKRPGKPIKNSKITIERFKVNPCYLRVCSPGTGCRLLPAPDEYCQPQ